MRFSFLAFQRDLIDEACADLSHSLYLSMFPFLNLTLSVTSLSLSLVFSKFCHSLFNIPHTLSNASKDVMVGKAFLLNSALEALTLELCRGVSMHG